MFRSIILLITDIKARDDEERVVKMKEKGKFLASNYVTLKMEKVLKK